MLNVVRSLSFGEDQRVLLRHIPEHRWPALLSQIDSARLTLPLALRCAESVPAIVRDRLERDLVNNALLHARRMAEYSELTEALRTRGVEFVVLKGIAQWPFYCDDLRHRPQYDIDIYCPPESVAAAYESAAKLGYRPADGAGYARAPHHLPVLIRDTGWRWRGDYYDPERPLMLEVHFQLWDSEGERFEPYGVNDFWDRRTLRNVDGLTFPALHPSDNLSFSAWHLARHLLHGNLCLYHVYELAHFLDRTAGHSLFWSEWAAAAPPSDRVVEAIAFRLATAWFGNRVHPAVCEQMVALPPNIRRWFELFAFSPLRSRKANKDELFLHLCLARCLSDRLRIVRKRILPGVRPRMGGGLVARRSVHHARALIPLLSGAMRWWL